MDNSLGPLCLPILTIALGSRLAVASLPLPGVHGFFRVPPALGRLPQHQPQVRRRIHAAHRGMDPLVLGEFGIAQSTLLGRPPPIDTIYTWKPTRPTKEQPP